MIYVYGKPSVCHLVISIHGRTVIRMGQPNHTPHGRSSGYNSCPWSYNYDITDSPEAGPPSRRSFHACLAQLDRASDFYTPRPTEYAPVLLAMGRVMLDRWWLKSEICSYCRGPSYPNSASTGLWRRELFIVSALHRFA